MGGQQSQEDDLIPLPQQQIVSVTDGVVDGTVTVAAGSSGADQRRPVPRVGTTREATAVRQPLVLARDAFRLRRRGHGDEESVSVTVEFKATVHGIVEFFAPARETPRRSDSQEDRSFAGGVTWPVIDEAPGGVHLTQQFSQGSGSKCGFNFDSRALPLNSRMQDEADGSTRWPLVLVFWPGAAVGQLGSLMASPPDGALLVACALHEEQVEVQKQIIAWGGQGAAFLIRELYGLREAQQQEDREGDGDAAPEVDNTALCVVCLTSPKDSALLPCGHLCVCYDCGASLRLNPLRNRCPLCRQPVHDLTYFKGIKHAASPANAAGEEVPAGAAEAAGEPAVEQEKAEAAEAPAANAVAAGPSAEDMRAARLRALEKRGAGAAGSSAEAVTDAAAQGPTSSTLPPKTMQRLARELKMLQTEKAAKRQEHGIEVSLADPDGDDMRVWTMHMFATGLDSGCDLRKALSSSGVESIEFEVWIPDRFPVEPPHVRVLQPYFSPGSFYVHRHGALCLEVLSSQGWTPAMSLMQMGVQVKAMMSQGHGSVSAGSCGEPGAYARRRARQIADHIEDIHKDWQYVTAS